jgi:hypothetical protein
LLNKNIRRKEAQGQLGNELLGLCNELLRLGKERTTEEPGSVKGADLEESAG